MNLQGFLDVLPMALEGWAGVFGVILVLVAIVAIFNKTFK